MLDTLLQLAGRAHPMLLHLPIGMLVALIALEVLALIRLIELPSRARAALAWLVFLTTAASIASGLLLEREPAYTGGTSWTDTLTLHKWLGFGFGILTLLAALSLATARTRRAYPLLLLLSAAAMFPVGHLGATMTHGEGFLTEPLRGSSTTADPALLPASSRGIYPEQIAPILDRYCVSCHGESKQQGKLALHTPDAIRAGGATGSAIEPGDPENSELIYRMTLPLASRDHMPPKSRPQPDARSLRLLEQWIAAGAPFEGGEPLPTDDAPPAEPPPPPPPPPAPSPQSGLCAAPAPSAPPAAALTAIRARHVHAEVIDPHHNLLWVSFDGATAIPDSEIAALLAPLAPFILDLSLAGTRAGPSTFAQLPRMPALQRLNLARTPTSSRDVAALSALASLEELNLSSTPLDDSAAQSLATGFTGLQRAFLWRSGLSEQALSSLRAARPALTLAVDSPPAAALETEPVPKVSAQPTP
jgi:uncharacterized membrane protein